jgi:hypothetical protein
MELMLESKPETCSALGLDCSDCVRQSASTVAKICTGLDSSGAQQLFFQMYPSSGCRPMAQAFAHAYLAAAIPEPRVLTFASAAA